MSLSAETLKPGPERALVEEAQGRVEEIARHLSRLVSMMSAVRTFYKPSAKDAEHVALLRNSLSTARAQAAELSRLFNEIEKHVEALAQERKVK